MRELGERLVGKAHIALAELVKNSYDADALNCEINFGDDRIDIVDNGHGMTLAEFRRFWMRVGTTHKQSEELSREFSRPLTGSKGVGRLAVQFLASQVWIETTAKGSNERLIVKVDWETAVQNEFLTEATATFKRRPGAGTYASGKPHGFRVILKGLREEWDERSLKGLAREVWTLRPPFEGFAGKTGIDEARDFKITLHSPGKEAFDTQISAAVEHWIAKIEGSIQEGWNTKQQTVTVTFSDGTKLSENFPIYDCKIGNCTWEIRIFNLSGHLGGNIKVGDAREYFSEFGGVHVYDGPFRLPYYGIQQDWLGIEFDHSHRKVKSKLLPDYYHVERALNDLPTQGRILGVVRVNTGSESRKAPDKYRLKGDYLKIQVTRDRLQINRSYEQLRDAVRLSVDYYAVCSMRRRIEEAKRRRPEETTGQAISRVHNVLTVHKEAIPAEVYADLKQQIGEFIDTAEREQEYRDTLAALLQGRRMSLLSSDRALRKRVVLVGAGVGGGHQLPC